MHLRALSYLLRIESRDIAIDICLSFKYKEVLRGYKKRSESSRSYFLKRLNYLISANSERSNLTAGLIVNESAAFLM